MNSDKKRFFEVFRDVRLPDGLAEIMEAVTINYIRLDNTPKRLDVGLSSDKIILPALLTTLEAELLNYINAVNSVNIYPTYSIVSDAEQLLKDFWPSLCFVLGKTSPLLSEVIATSEWRLDSGVLHITTPSDIDLLLHKNDGISAIKSILSECVGLELDVGISCLKEQKTHTDKLDAKPVPRPVAPPQKVDKPKTQKSVPHRVAGEPRPLSGNFFEEESVTVHGRIFRLESRETRGKKVLYVFDITDNTGSITCKMFLDQAKVSDFADLLAIDSIVKVAGQVQFDTYSNELIIMASKLAPSNLTETTRADDAPVKRVELHLHTNMSQLDALTPAADFIKRAAEWGHKAVAITDHGVVQAYPEAMEAAKKHGIKVIYGIEAYLVDDTALAISVRPDDARLDEDFVVFDLETTGLNRERNTIIEIGAVKVSKGEVSAIFHRLIDPKKPLPSEIIKLTQITDAMLAGQPSLEVILPEFLEFIGDMPLVAHNADFDMGFLEHHAAVLGHDVTNPYICTLQLSRALYPDLPRHNLAAMVKHHSVNLENHHRASDDAAALAEIFLQQKAILDSQQIVTLNHINLRYAKKIDVKSLRPHHAVILVKNQAGLRNLYELVSLSHLDYFHRQPRIPKSEFLRLREGLLIGTACESGELFSAVKEKRNTEYIDALAAFYDYFEIQPIANNQHLLDSGQLDSPTELQDIYRRIVELGDVYGKPVVATSDAHFLDPGLEIYRAIIMAGNGFKDADQQPPLYFATTDEMLECCAYLGSETAYRVVVENTNLIADMIEHVLPIPDGSFPPVSEGSEEQLISIVTNNAKRIYGDPLPDYIQNRIDRELHGIIKGGFAVMYVAAHKLVANSVENGYLVGSRGSIGSSFVATMAGISEVNPLSPHYYCPQCQFSDFDSAGVLEYAGASGCDMPDRNCPKCGTSLGKEGHSIPFETFLGFNADKEPDIDLNFSGEYQEHAHTFAEQLFGEGYVFKAGTISTIAERTAFGYVKKYLEEHGRMERNAEINRMVLGCTGIKRTTGQHPGGLVLVPRGKSVYDFTPIQRPANDAAKGVITTHFDFHSIEGRLLKLDILGHDVPTIVKILQDLTGLDPTTIDIADKDVLSLFRSPDKLGVSENDINCKTGTLGLPEFGTPFVRQMLIDAKPSTFADLARISGLSHGTGIWLGNGLDLVRQNVATLKEIPSIRDDIMTYLISKGVDTANAFKITENVRKGRGLTDAEVEIMLAAGVPRWYIDSCRKIVYMFPKGHAVAYVMMAMRIGYYKIHYPAAFYAATFSAKSDDFDYEKMCKGPEIARQEMRRINALGHEATAKDEKSMVLLELVNEMYARGLSFAKLDLYQAAADKFTLIDGKLMPPLCAVAGLGAAVAEQVVTARAEGEFFTIADLKIRTKINKTVVELLKNNGILDGMDETEQMTLF